jgi:hypothetical protein
VLYTYIHTYIHAHAYMHTDIHIYIQTYILKNVRNITLSAKARGMVPRKVVEQPSSTAGPISTRQFVRRSLGVREKGWAR